MALTHQDFQLSDEPLAVINGYFEGKAKAVRDSGEHILCPTLNVQFTFAPFFGLSVHISYDSEPTPHEIEYQWTDSP